MTLLPYHRDATDRTDLPRSAAAAAAVPLLSRQHAIEVHNSHPADTAPAPRYVDLLADADYRRGFLAMIGGATATGLVRGGTLLTLQRVAGASAGWSLQAYAGIEWAEQAGRSVGRMRAAASRDAADVPEMVARRGEPAQRRLQAAAVARYGLTEAGCHAAALAACAALWTRQVPAPYALLGLAASRCATAYATMCGTGAFGCLKVHLGSASTRATQAQLSRTAVAVEALPLDNCERQIPALLLLLPWPGELAGAAGTLLAAGAVLGVLARAPFVALAAAATSPAEAAVATAERDASAGAAASLVACVGLLAERDYRQYVIACLMGAAANALARTGMLLLLGTLATHDAALPLRAAACAAGVEQLGRSVSFILASRARDLDPHPDACSATDTESSWSLVRHGAAIVGAQIAVAATGLGYSLGWAGPGSIAACVVGSRGVQAYCEGGERGAFDRIKRRLGSAAHRATQERLNRTITALESVVLNNIERLLPPALLGLAAGTDCTGTTAALWVLGAGVGLATLPRAFFAWRAGNADHVSPHRPQAPAGAA